MSPSPPHDDRAPTEAAIVLHSRTSTSRRGAGGAALRRLASEEAGFTSIELLVSAFVLGLVLVGVLGVLDHSVKQAPKDQERAHQIREAQVGLSRMTRELRHARQVLAPAPGTFGSAVDVFIGDRRVRYRCNEPVGDPDHPNDRACVRQEGNADASVEPTGSDPVVARVLNGETAFTAPPAGQAVSYVTARIEVPARGGLKKGHDHRVVLDDGVYFRNRGL